MKLDEIFQYIQETILITDNEGNICNCLGNHEKILNLKQEGIIKKNIKQLLDIDFYSYNGQVLKHKNNDGMELELEIARNNVGKESIWIIKDKTDEVKVEKFLDEYHDNLTKELNQIVKQKTIELVELNKQLEAKVAARTKELEYQKRELEKSIERLKETQTRLVESEKMAHLGKLAIGLSHEISTPLGVCVMATELIMENLKNRWEKNISKEEDEENVYALKLITRNVERANMLIKSLRNLSGELYLGDVESFNLREVIDEVWDIIKMKYGSKKYEIYIIGAKKLIIKDYREAYFQILRNFMENSIVHGFNKKETGKICIKYKIQNNKLDILYSDNGKNIDDCTMKRLFDPYFTTRGGKGNSGIGLNIVKNLVVVKLNGSINVRNTDDGVEFEIKVQQQHNF